MAEERMWRSGLNIIKLCNSALKLYRESFFGKSIQVHLTSVSPYSVFTVNLEKMDIYLQF